MSKQNYNEDVLLGELNFKRIGNTSQFINKVGIFVFSPVVARNTQDSYWFDINERNLKRREKYSYITTILLVRVIMDKKLGTDKFLFVDFGAIEKIINLVKADR